jgi:hypothetical protein
MDFLFFSDACCRFLVEAMRRLFVYRLHASLDARVVKIAASELAIYAIRAKKKNNEMKDNISSFFPLPRDDPATAI